MQVLLFRFYSDKRTIIFLLLAFYIQLVNAQDISSCSNQAIKDSRPAVTTELTGLLATEEQLHLEVEDNDVIPQRTITNFEFENPDEEKSSKLYFSSFENGPSIVLFNSNSIETENIESYGEQRDEFWLVGRYSQMHGMSGEVQVGEWLNFHGDVNLIRPLNKYETSAYATQVLVEHHNQFQLAQTSLPQGPQLSLLLDLALTVSFDSQELAYTTLPGAGLGLRIGNKKAPVKIGLVVSPSELQFSGIEKTDERNDHYFLRLSTPPF